MMVEMLVILAVSLVPTISIHCEEDKDLEDVQEYTQKVHNIGNLNYWRTAQQNFQVFGKFDGDPSASIIKAGYYTENNVLIYGITINCGNKNWSSQVKNHHVTNWIHGDLITASCESGAIFDIWFKVHQPFMMSWIFNGQALQFDTRMSYILHGTTKLRRIRPLRVPTKYGSNKGKYFKVTATGAAKFTRLTWGQCVSWPKSMKENCQGARQWVQSRSKMKPVSGLGRFGSDMPIFAPTCFLNSKYYNYLQENVHPDRRSGGKPWCCCVDMVTGRTINDDDETSCAVTREGKGGCEVACVRQARHDLIAEVMAQQDQLDLIP